MQGPKLEQRLVAVADLANATLVTEQTTVVAKDGTEYRPSNIKQAGGYETLQLVRCVPKLSKAEKKAAKRRRHANA